MDSYFVDVSTISCSILGSVCVRPRHLNWDYISYMHLIQLGHTLFCQMEE